MHACCKDDVINSFTVCFIHALNAEVSVFTFQTSYRVPPLGSFETEHKVTCLFFRQEDGEFLNEARSFAKLGFTQYMYVDSIHLS